MADAGDLKSPGENRVGSTPTRGTMEITHDLVRSFNGEWAFLTYVRTEEGEVFYVQEVIPFQLTLTPQVQTHIWKVLDFELERIMNGKLEVEE